MAGENWRRFVPSAVPPPLRDYGFNKDFLRLCWMDDKDTDSIGRAGNADVQEQHGYRDWILNVGGVTVEGAPRASTPDSVSEDLSSSTCSPPSVATSVLAQFTSDGFRSPSTSSMDRILSESPVPWRSSCTPPPSDKGDEHEHSELTEAEQDCLASRRRKPSPMLCYYLWEQHQETTQARDYLPSAEKHSVGRWLQNRDNLLVQAFDI